MARLMVEAETTGPPRSRASPPATCFGDQRLPTISEVTRLRRVGSESLLRQRQSPLLRSWRRWATEAR